MNTRNIAIIAIIIIIIAAVGIYAYSAISNSPDTSKLRISTTTSLDDTGLLKELEAAYEKKYPGVDVQVVSGGTGIAIQYGERGDVDLMLVHDKNRETKFVSDGFGTNRTEFAYNYFWIVGPASDPAGIKGMNATEAFKTIAQQGQTNPNVIFVSRGDASGTNARELQIWKSAGIDINKTKNSSSWYIESGKGMGDTLIIANEKQAYTLSDSGTFLSFSKDAKITLVALVTTGKELLNIYTAIPVNPQKHPKTNIEGANNFVNFLVSPEGQQIIGNYGKGTVGQPLFTPIPTNPIPALITPLVINSVPA